MAISVHGTSERRWRLRHSVSDCAVRSGKTLVLSGDGGRSVLQSGMRQSVRSLPADEGHRSGTDHNDVHDRRILRSDTCTGGAILRRLVPKSSAVERVPAGVDQLRRF